MADPALRFSEHALDRMLEWRLEVRDVETVLDEGETIEEYEDGSRLVYGWAANRPLHVVVADAEDRRICTVVTVYEPDPARWDASLKRRRPR